MGIVNRFQVINIAKEQEQTLRIAARELKLLRRRSKKAAPVIQARQIVSEG
jgi:hypothetical protein